MDGDPFELRTCLINRLQAIFDASRYLDDAVPLAELQARIQGRD